MLNVSKHFMVIQTFKFRVQLKAQLTKNLVTVIQHKSLLKPVKLIIIKKLYLALYLHAFLLYTVATSGRQTPKIIPTAPANKKLYYTIQLNRLVDSIFIN